MDTQFDRVALSFKNQHVLVTGSTGFMGKAFLEKILRSTEVAKLYLIMRPKKGVEPEKRILQIFEDPLYDTLKATKNIVEIMKKIEIIEGDCSQVELGISHDNRKLLTEKVTLIYNLAATTRFDAPLRSAVNLNVRGTFELLKIARECKKLQLFCHISTAYCHLDQKILHEAAYPPPFKPSEIMEIVSQSEDIDKDVKKFLSPTIPNTYVLTKAIAEALIEEAHNSKFPVIILRPSIITPTIREPVSGWTNSYNGMSGLMIAIGKGILRDIHCDGSYYADNLPVDVAIHCVMVCTWSYLSNICDKEKYIMSLTSSNEVKLTHSEVYKKGLRICVEKYPMFPILWYPGLTLTKYRWLHLIKVLFVHWIPAYIADFYFKCVGVEPFLVKIHKGISYGMRTTNIFRNTQWNFDNSNMVEIVSKLNDVEKKTYILSSEGIDIEEYMETCVKGGHEFLLKTNSTDKNFYTNARSQIKFMFYVDKTLKLIFASSITYFVLKLLNLL